MKFTATLDQQELLATTGPLFAREAGPARARLLGTDGHDEALLELLSLGGYLDLARTDEYGFVTAALVAEQASRSSRSSTSQLACSSQPAAR
jgi:hypothetical protein